MFLFNADKKARVELMMKCGSTYTLHELGNGPKYKQAKFARARLKCLQQVHLRSPNLPVLAESVWEAHTQAFARLCQNDWKQLTGQRFLNKINLLIATLGVHYHGHEDVKAKQTPSVKAWLKEHCKKTDGPRAFEDFVHGLGAWLPKSLMNLPTG